MAAYVLVRFSNWLESQLEERTPSERVILLQGLLALKMWLVPPHMAHIFGFCGTWRRPGHLKNLGKSFQIVARANLAAPPVCPLLRRQFVHFCLSISATVFLNISFWICFPLVMDRDFGDWESLQWKKWRILMMIITNFWLVWCNWLINKKLWSEMKRRGGEAWYNVWSGNYLFVFFVKTCPSS